MSQKIFTKLNVNVKLNLQKYLCCQGYLHSVIEHFLIKFLDWQEQWHTQLEPDLPSGEEIAFFRLMRLLYERQLTNKRGGYLLTHNTATFPHCLHCHCHYWCISALGKESGEFQPMREEYSWILTNERQGNRKNIASWHWTRIKSNVG